MGARRQGEMAGSMSKKRDRALKGSIEYDPMKAIGADYWLWKAERIKSGQPSLYRELGYTRSFEGRTERL